MSDDAARSRPLEEGVPLGELAAAGMVTGRLADTELLVIKDGDDYHAVAALCTHKGAPLRDGLVAGGEIRCPWHHARFCLRTGAALAAPAFEALQRFDTEVRGDRLFIGGRSEPASAPAPSHAPKRVVIVGAGAGGYACADALMKSGFKDVTLINDDPDASYDRTMCSKDYLSGEEERSRCAMPMDMATRGSVAGVTLLRNTAKMLDLDDRTVGLDTGTAVGYDVLVLATGAEPERPSIAGLDPERLYVLRTLADADALIAAAGRAKAVAVVGTSFIGLEAAASLKQRGLDVHVIAPDEVPLAKSVGAAVGAMIRTAHEKKGVVFHLGRKAESYRAGALTLDDGSLLEVDFVVAGVGVKPRTQLAEAAGIAVAANEEGGGVIVDERLESSVSGVFAIGDIARYPNPRTGARTRIEHWVHAQRQGQFVARAILGDSGIFDDVPFFWTAHFETSLRYVGHVDSPDAVSNDGNIAAHDFSLHLADRSGGRAMVTCERDLESLRAEVNWEKDSRAAH